jgi:thymidylate synthase
MNNVDKQYLELIQSILDKGELKDDRTGTGTISIFDYSMRFDMSEGFPLITSKKVFTKAVIHELIWFLRGDTNIKYLVDNDVHIWDGDCFSNYLKNRDKFSNKDNIKEDVVINGIHGSSNRQYTKEEFINKIKTNDEFAEKWGDLGPVYGKQWRAWGGWDKVPSGWNHNTVTDHKLVPKNDQISNLINDLKNNPDSRRLIVSAWNVDQIHQMVLPPCHFVFQCYTSNMSLDERKKWWCDSLSKNISYAEDLEENELNALNVPKRRLSLKWTQRSVDVGLGLSFNIASYGLLLHLLAKEVNMVPNELIFSGGDCHIYLNHIDALKKQLSNETYNLPSIILTNESIAELKYDDIKIIGYKSSGIVKMELSN